MECICVPADGDEEQDVVIFVMGCPALRNVFLSCLVLYSKEISRNEQQCIIGTTAIGKGKY